MSGVSNEKIYYELRARQRRTVAKMMLELLLFGIIFWQLHSLLDTYLTLSLTFICGFGAAMAFSWLLANEHGGYPRRIVESITGPEDWPADIRRRLEERGEF